MNGALTNCAHPVMTLLAEELRSGVRWRHLPPAWVLALVLLPVVVFLAWWAYRKESELSPARKGVLGTLRAAAFALFLLVLFGPYAELYDTREVRSHLVVLVDQSQSMATVDSYEPEDARKLAEVTGVPAEQTSQLQRVDLVKRALSAPAGPLGRWTKDFRLHVFAFGAQATPVVSVGDSEGDGNAANEPLDDLVRKRLAEIQATEPATRIGQAVAAVCDTFRLRDEPVAGIVVVSDGQENGTVVTPAAAGRRAASMHVPVFAVGVGDPRSPRNVHVGNLRAKEVVLARDDAVFEFTAHAKGFEGRRAKVELSIQDERGRLRPMPITPAEIVLEGKDADQQVRFKCKFTEAGEFTLRIGIPVQPEEKIKSDNFVLHTIRVIDRKIKVLLVDTTPRNEFLFLARALTRDVETILAHTLLLDADPDAPQSRTMAPGWDPIDAAAGLPRREKLFEYDVVLLGDVDWRDLHPSEDKAREALQNLRDFVDKGGGLGLIAGPRNMPTRYKDTDLQGLVPIVIDRNAERSDPHVDPARGFGVKLTPDGRESPVMNIESEAEASVARWEKDSERFTLYWSYPALRAKTMARVLAVSTHPAHTDPRHGARPLLATMLYGRGRVLYVGTDDLWRSRLLVADRFFYRFYGEAVRFLATHKLLGGNARFKILTDRDQYGQDEPVRITLDVLDRDYEPSKAPSHTVTIDMPGAQPGARESVDLEVKADRNEAGAFRATILPTRAGEYRIRGKVDDPQQEQPTKVFRVIESTVEGRNLLLDEATLTRLSEASEGGRYVHLTGLGTLDIATRTQVVPTDRREDDLWDGWWTIAVATGLLAAEWLLRKRWNLV
ncbi:MAG: hypothetical protein HMLKMBBP_01260 [Planctomycetes bacterium]|nr:hypothetical protein [Planctomycetota bacterium]